MFKKSVFKSNSHDQRPKWRKMQNKHQHEIAKRRSYQRFPLYLLILGLLFLIVTGIFRLMDKSLDVNDKKFSSIFAQGTGKFDKITRRKIINHIDVANSTQKDFELKAGGDNYQIFTSLVPSLQKCVIEKIDRKNSLYFGFVAIQPETGRILSMVSYNRLHPRDNICFKPEFPAASVFKIVTAAAAIEKCGFDCNTPVSFVGNKYTLYKRQLKNNTSRYATRLTFQKSFAQSVNPVFGKIGKLYLGKTLLNSYAAAFGFNQEFNFEIPFKPGCIYVNNDPFNWAEVACGFNNKTCISPVHGSLLISIILNDGVLIAPTIIDNIKKEDKILYQQQPEVVTRVIQPGTARKLKRLLSATVSYGTASRSFHGDRHDKVLSKLLIGGKTGSINNHTNYNIRYDWFVGFAQENSGPKKIVISVFVAHKDYIGIHASEYARLAIKNYFKNNNNASSKT